MALLICRVETRILVYQVAGQVSTDKSRRSSTQVLWWQPVTIVNSKPSSAPSSALLGLGGRFPLQGSALWGLLC